MIFESVPGKQVTLAHLISNPDPRIFNKLGLSDSISNAIGILTITPSDVAIIAVDLAKKETDIKIGFVDRFCGAVCILGDVSAVEMGINRIIKDLQSKLGFSVCKITRT
ncbi:BMC domain-containing protein [Ignavigranum ruoffiae]|nr:BMC domain-containing protein [Ignavigranum ruoffiae]